jgi:uncharacterized protein involved in outer membrane biogenesis
MKKLAGVALTALLFCGAALWFLASGSLNEFVKTQIEELGSKYTEQQVHVAKVDIKLSKGAGSIQGLSITNPTGYLQTHAFNMDNISLDIDIASLVEDPIVIETLIINKPQAMVEFTQQGSANVKEIIDNIKKHLPKTAKSTKVATGKEANIRVNRLLLNGVALTLDLRQLGANSYQEQLPDVDLGLIGGEQGLPASQLGAEIAKQVVDSIWQSAKNKQKQKLLELTEQQVKKKIDEAKLKLQQKTEEAKQQLKDKTDAAKDDLKEKAKQKLKGLLGT